MTPRTAAGPRTKARLAYEEAWQNGYEAGKAEADRSLLLDAALRALVEALTVINDADLGWSMDEGDPVGVAYHAARAALAATDVRGALDERHQILDDLFPVDR